MLVTARHGVDPRGAGSRAYLSLRYEGLVGPLFGRLTVRDIQLSTRTIGRASNGLANQDATFWAVLLDSSDGGRYFVKIEPFGGMVTNVYKVDANWTFQRQ